MGVIRSVQHTAAVALLACSPAKPAEQADAENAADDAAEPASEQGNPFAEGGKLPPDVTDMLDERPCSPKLRVALEQHALMVESEDGTRERVFLIAPGEMLCLVGSASEGPLSDLELAEGTVSQENASQNLISVEFKTTSVGTVLVVKNHHDKPLRYRALMKIPGKDPEPTSVCAVRAGLAGMEHWPHSIEVLTIGDFTLLEPGAPLDCQ